MKKLWVLARMELALSLRTPQSWIAALGLPVLLLIFNGSLFAKGDPRVVAELVPGSLSICTLASGLFGTAIPLVNLRERGMLRRIRLTPILPPTVIVAVLLGHVAVALLGFVFVWGIAAGMFHAVPQHLLAQLGMYLCGAFTFVAAGLIVGSACATTQAAAGWSNLLFLPCMFLSGTAVPLQFLPSSLQRLATFLPSGYLVGGLRRLQMGGRGVDIAFCAAVLMVSAILLLGVDFNLFRWDAAERVSKRRLYRALAFALATPLLAGVCAPLLGVRLT